MKKPLPFVLAAVVGLFAAPYAQAQLTIGPRVGANLSTVHFELKEDFDAPEVKRQLGPQVGLTLNAQFGNWALQPSVLYSQKGFGIDDTRTESFDGEEFKLKSTGNARLGYLEVPINVVYTVGGDNGFQVFAGPYLGVGVGGSYDIKYKVTGPGLELSDSNSSSVRYTDKAGDDDKLYVRRFDAGLNAGIGYKTGPFQAQLGYGLGLANLAPKDADGEDTGDKIRNRTISLSLNYFFALSK